MLGIFILFGLLGGVAIGGFYMVAKIVLFFAPPIAEAWGDLFHKRG